MKKLTSTFVCVVLIGYSALLKSQTANSSYKIANKISVKGDGGWDYLTVDDSTGRLYISHGTVVDIVNPATGVLVGIIDDTKGVHGIALARDLKKAYISNGKDTSVTVINMNSFATFHKIKVTGINPDAILYDTFSHKVFVFNGKTSNATVINTETDAIIATIDLPGKPEFSVTDEKGKIYVNIEDKSKLCVINATTLKLEQTWSVSPGVEPSGLAMDIKHNRLFSVCDNKLMIILDAQTGKVITSLPIGEGVDGAAFDADKERAYSSNGDGTLTVVQGENGENYSVLENIITQKGARTITLNKKTHHLYLSTAEFSDKPIATAENPNPRPAIKPGTFVVLDIAPVN